MNIDVYTVAGLKKGMVELPPSLFDGPINVGLMHQAVRLQQANRRHPIAHSKSRGEIRGSTRKVYQQKGTGRARRGSIRSPLLRGGNKAFGPKSTRNFSLGMPRKMRHAALRSCLSYRAKDGVIIGLEQAPEFTKTKNAHAFLQKFPVDLGRRILVVLADGNTALTRSMRNIPGVKTLLASYLNPEDVLSAHRIVFVVEALEKAEKVFGKASEPVSKPNKPNKPNQPV